MVFPSNLPEATLAAIGSSTGAILGYFFGANMEAVVWLFAIMAVDYVLGTVNACKKGRWESSISKQGLMGKCIILFLCAFGAGLDIVCHVSFIQAAFIGCFAVAEIGSVVETIDDLGFGNVIPTPIRHFLAKMKEKEIVGMR